MKENREITVCTVFCLIGIAYITLLSRMPTLTREIHLQPFWSYMSAMYGKQILLNIVLFIPLGFLLMASLTRSKHPVLWVISLAFVISCSIELLQFATYRGMLDVDDLGSNLFGAVVGLVAFRLEKNRKWQRTGMFVVMCAIVVGCIMASLPMRSLSEKRTEDYEFNITSVRSNEDKLIIEGVCYTYYRKTPKYVLLINGLEADVDVIDNTFTARSKLPNEKTNVQIKFQGYPVIDTGFYLSPSSEEVKIEYVPGVIPVVDGVSETAVLKCFNAEYDVMVFEDKKRLLWLIGDQTLDSNTEAIFHIHTNEPDKLPISRVQYGFDNYGFRADTATAIELDRIGNYRVFEKEIPQDYYITSITVGFNTNGSIIWADSFRIQH